MDKQDDYHYILQEAVATLVERAKLINQETIYNQGRAMAYYEILSQLSSLADEAGVDPKDFGLENVSNLVGLKKAA